MASFSHHVQVDEMFGFLPDEKPSASSAEAPSAFKVGTLDTVEARKYEVSALCSLKLLTCRAVFD